MWHRVSKVPRRLESEEKVTQKHNFTIYAGGQVQGRGGAVGSRRPIADLCEVRDLSTIVLCVVGCG